MMWRYLIAVIILFGFFSFSNVVFADVQPVWTKDYETEIKDYKISIDGNYVLVGVGQRILLYDSDGEELWNYSSTKFYDYGLDISPDGKYLGVGVHSADAMGYRTIGYLLNWSGNEVFKVGESSGYRGGKVHVTHFFNETSKEDSIYLSTGHTFDHEGVELKFAHEDGISMYYYPVSLPYYEISITPEFALKVYCDNNIVYFSKYKWKKTGGEWMYMTNDSEKLEYGLLSQCLDFSISLDGEYVVAGSKDDYMYIFNGSGNLIKRFKSEGDVSQVSILKKDASYFISGLSRDGYIYVLDEKGSTIGKYFATSQDASISSVGSYVKIEPPSTDTRLGYYETEFTKEIRESKFLKIVLLSNSIDQALASDFLGFLQNKGIEVEHTNEMDFDQFKEEKFIVILGGPDAYEGVGEIVQEVLTESEQNQLRDNGNHKMYVKTNVWAQGQKVMVIAGSTREETKAAHQENKNQVVSEADY